MAQTSKDNENPVTPPVGAVEGEQPNAGTAPLPEAPVSTALDPTDPQATVTDTPIAADSGTTSSTDPQPGQPVDNPDLEAAMAAATAPKAPTGPTPESNTSSGGFETMVVLDGLYNDITAISKRIEASTLSLAHEDVTDLSEALNIARTWLAQKLMVYNPEHASLLRDIPNGPDA